MKGCGCIIRCTLVYKYHARKVVNTIFIKMGESQDIESMRYASDAS